MMLRYKLLSVLLLLALLLTSCTYVQLSEDKFYSFTDFSGRKVELSSPPQNVAVLFSSFAEVWSSAGGKVNITVGESIERGFVSEDSILVDDSAGKSINNELLLASKPDFVIASADIEAHINTARILTDAGIPCALFRVECFEDYYEMLNICTDITSNKEAYKKYGTDVKTQIERILNGAYDSDKKILFIRSGSSSRSAKAKTSDEHFAAAMLEELGTYNIAENAPVLLEGLSLEEILKEDPEYIFISTMGNDQAAKAYMDSVFNQDSWKTLSAVKNGNCIYLPKEMFQFKPNARWADAYSYLANILYEK